jgi:flagellar protein FliS
MQSSARESYLVAEVTTAPPQKLHLMLIEAAIRSGQQAREKWLAGEDAAASEALVRSQEIVGELLSGLNREADPELVRRVASVYLFVFRSLMEANHQRDENKLNEALRVLKIERDTWRQVCRQLGNRNMPDPAETSSESPRQPAANPPAPHASRLPLAGVPADLLHADDSPTSGFSLEA